MNKDLTKLVFVIDRSGSMASMQEEAESGINALLEEQKKASGSVDVTIFEFDHECYCPYSGYLKDCPEYRLVPRGSTALFDAVGAAIVEVGIQLSAMPEDQRPGLVMVVVMTDGMENSSKEYTRERIAAMVKEQTEKYNWQFTFLAKDPTSFQQAGHMHISAQASGQYSSVANAYISTSAKIMRMRGMAQSGATYDSLSVANNFTEDELRAMGDSRES